MIKFALKDNIVCKGKISQAASNVLKGYKSAFNSTIVELLSDYDFKFVNMDEFGMGSFGVHSAYGPVSIEGRVVGGSSSGCAAAVKTEQCEIGIGTDSGGSIRLPAAFCDLYGFKPTYGRISRFGVITYCQSLDTIGILSRNLKGVVDTFRLLDKWDNKDPTAIPEIFRNKMIIERKEVVVGIPINILDNKFLDTVRYLTCNPNIKFKKINLDYFEYSLACYYIIATAEASSALNKYNGLLYPERRHSLTFEENLKYTRSKFGKEVLSRLQLGDFVLNNDAFETWFLQAAKVRKLIQMDYERVFKAVDYVLMPTTLQKPPLVEDVLNPSINDYRSDSYTVGPSLSGLPTLSFPINGISLQFIGPVLSDLQLLRDVRHLII